MWQLHKKIFSYLLLTSGLSLSFATPVKADPVQCYIGKGGTYKVCDLQTVKPQHYLLVWPDGERTAIIETRTSSGSWIDVRHARANGDMYGGGTRYPATHYEQGKWLCYHRQPGKRGGIDFCITP